MLLEEVVVFLSGLKHLKMVHKFKLVNLNQKSRKKVFLSLARNTKHRFFCDVLSFMYLIAGMWKEEEGKEKSEERGRKDAAKNFCNLQKRLILALI